MPLPRRRFPSPAATARLALLAAALGALTGCAAGDSPAPVVVVGAAASLRPVVEELAEGFDAEVTIVAGSSGALAAQVRQGAPRRPVHLRRRPLHLRTGARRLPPRGERRRTGPGRTCGGDDPAALPCRRRCVGGLRRRPARRAGEPRTCPLRRRGATISARCGSLGRDRREGCLRRERGASAPVRRVGKRRGRLRAAFAGVDSRRQLRAAAFSTRSPPASSALGSSSRRASWRIRPAPNSRNGSRPTRGAQPPRRHGSATATSRSAAGKARSRWTGPRSGSVCRSA